MPKNTFIQVADDFWNIRGSFKIGSVADIGTHVSLVQLQNGKFVFLDSYTLSDSDRQAVDQLTNDGRDIEAILNLHPFHTLHVAAMHAMYPNAKLFGTARHKQKNPELPWEKLHTDSAELHSHYEDDFDFSVPAGVDFVSSNDNIHFSSVLVMHRSSKTIHVDDTFMYIRPPILKKWFELPAALSFHPTLAQALQRRTDATQEFKAWAEQLTDHWGYAENLCAAHTTPLLKVNNKGASIKKRMQKALRNVNIILLLHKRWYG